VTSAPEAPQPASPAGTSTQPASPAGTSKLRLGGMALRNGLLVHGPTHWAAAELGPPTTRRSSTLRTAATVTSYSRRYSSRDPLQNTSRFASFQTSKLHRSQTSSSP